MSGRSEAASNHVTWKFGPAPAHPLRMCAGVFIVALLATACEPPPDAGARGPRTLELDGDTLAVPANVSLIDVKLRAVGNTDFAPAEITAKVGDIVRFTSADSRTHGIVLHPPTPEAGSVLRAAGQLRSPPLVAKGQAFVVSLEKLPPGRYTVSCISHAGTATIIVQ